VWTWTKESFIFAEGTSNNNIVLKAAVILKVNNGKSHAVEDFPDPVQKLKFKPEVKTYVPHLTQVRKFKLLESSI